MDLHGTGIWSGALRFGDRGAARDAAAELEHLGYSALWVPGGVGGDVFGDCGALLEVTERAVVATGILNLWMHEPAETAAGHASLTAAYPGRFLLGIGVSHSALVDRDEAGRYQKPIAVTRRYLDALDGADPPVPVAERALAALGPKMLELARDRTRGAHPYLANPDHTRLAREVLGDGPLLMPEQPVVLETDSATARDLARAHFTIYLTLPNYVNNLKRIGFTDDDVAEGGSDRLIDGVVAWGDEATIAARVRQHFEAGADHVCVQVVTPRGIQNLPLDQWRALAPALTGS
ncbi:MAG TPA: LLM class F420-dependent oxidoreductase [Acidimicrobiia bacterium]|nr:LLM class F420-dependent oxidoreductase [Acidimicrobiia bacterium]